MNELAQNQELLITALKLIAFVFCFILVMILGVYNWLYLAKILKSNDHIGVKLPQNIHHLVRSCIFIPLVTAVCICIFLLFRIY